MKIEILKPFNEAFELMKKILFQPFYLKKWCVLGFAAFLAGHFSVGGFSPPLPFGNTHPGRPSDAYQPQQLGHVPPWVFSTVTMVFFVVILALILLLTWVRSRGVFVLTDCIVHNRAAIAKPWREYRKEGNSYFLFLMAIVLLSFALVLALIAAFFIPLALTNYQPGGAALAVLIILGAIILILWLCASVVIGMVAYFMVPVMYIRRCHALDAFRDVIGLVRNHVGPFVLVALFTVALFVTLMTAGSVVTCATCCIAAIPYIGTVIMLPAFVWLHAFGLLFLRQFGPDYDVWAGIVSTQPPPAPSFPPPIQG